MSGEKHTKFLRSIPHVYSLNRETVTAIWEAADYIDELEGQIKMLNKLGNIDSSPGLVERVAALENRTASQVTQIDLEQFGVQLRADFSRFVTRR